MRIIEMSLFLLYGIFRNDLNKVYIAITKRKFKLHSKNILGPIVKIYVHSVDVWRQLREYIS